MTEPTYRGAREAESNRLNLDLPQEPMALETEAERAARQPLFNKRKMVFWAILTLAAYFTVSIAIPAAFHATKESVKAALQEASRPGVNPEVRTIVLPNGKRITITKTREGVTINETRPGAAAAPIAPAKPPEPATPAVPAPDARK